jgi:hypothetical protein
MVIVLRLGIFALILCCVNVSYPNPTCTTATEYQPELCRVKLPKITSVHIEENGLVSKADNNNTNCSTFKLTASHVRRYFFKALEIKNKENSLHTLDWLPCYASGTMHFSDNREVRWKIHQNQTGTLVFDTNQEIFFYCPDCKFSPFLY